MRRLLILAAVLATACQPMPAQSDGNGTSQTPPPVRDVDTTDVPPAVRVPENASVAECAARGGEMRPVGRAQSMQCVVAYADAGKRCTTGSDCQGDCRVETAPFPPAGTEASGRCQADSQPFGCHAKVENGRVAAAICID